MKRANHLGLSVNSINIGFLYVNSLSIKFIVCTYDTVPYFCFSTIFRKIKKREVKCKLSTMSQYILYCVLIRNSNDIVPFFNVTALLIQFNEKVTLAQKFKNAKIFSTYRK